MPAEEVEIEIPEETADGQDTEDLEFEDPGVTETIKKAKLKKILISAGSVMLAALLVIGLRAIYIKGKKKLSPHQRINLLAEPLEKENSLSEESYALLEKLHYSKSIADQSDEDIIKSLGADTAAVSNMINDFNNINEILVWAFVTRDEKNNKYKVNIRSRGPIINEIAAKYEGGGHKYASGVRNENKEDIEELLKDLSNCCKDYMESSDKNGNN